MKILFRKVNLLFLPYFRLYFLADTFLWALATKKKGERGGKGVGGGKRGRKST
jgi:hypothetical protein